MSSTSTDYHVTNPTTHGCSYTRLYNVWIGMKQRCDNPNNAEFKHYGGKGVSVCPEWKDFIAFKKWAEASGYKTDLTIDRKDSNGNYCPDNCRWLTRADNCRLAHEIKYRLLGPDGYVYMGVNIAEFARRNKLDPSCLSKVLKGKRPSHKGWTKF